MRGGIGHCILLSLPMVQPDVGKTSSGRSGKNTSKRHHRVEGNNVLALYNVRCAIDNGTETGQVDVVERFVVS